MSSRSGRAKRLSHFEPVHRLPFGLDENMAFLFEGEMKPPINLSPYTEWRASMMGLAGRDPIFHAQLESEKAMRPSQTEFFDNTCYRCHGVMGQRQIELDKQEPFQAQHGLCAAG